MKAVRWAINMITKDYGKQIEAAVASTRIESKLQQMEDRADLIKEVFTALSDSEICAFEDWIYRNEDETLMEFIENRVYDELRESNQ